MSFCDPAGFEKKLSSLSFCMKSFMSFILFSTITSLCVAQHTETIDSLENNLASLTGENKARAYYDLVSHYIRRDQQKSNALLVQAIQFEKQHPSTIIKAFTSLVRAIHVSHNGLQDSAIVLLEEAKQAALQEHNSTLLIRVYASLSKVYIAAGKTEKALTNLFEAMRLLDAHPNTEIELKMRVNITWAYLELKNYKECIRFGNESLKQATNPRFEWIFPLIYNNVAAAYGALGKLDSSQYFARKGIALAKKNNDLHTLANGYFILGDSYAEAGKYDLAIEQYLKAKPYREKSGNPSYVIADLYVLSDLYYKSGRYREGIKTGLEALTIAEKYNLQLKFEGTYESLAKNYEGLRDFGNASKYYRLLASAKDSVYQNATAEALAEMRTRYETEKKEQHIAVQKAELKEQEAKLSRTYIIILALAITVVLIIIILVLVRSRYKRRQELLKAAHELSIREAHIKASIESQENERKRFAQDLHDGMGQLISALRLILSSITSTPSLQERTQLVDKSEKVLNEMYREIRGIAFNLMPQTLIQQGLVAALQEIAVRINHAEKIHVTVNSFNIHSRLPEVQEVSLFRIIQEWITNIMKYAEATTIHVQIVGHEDEVTITIEDNGKGFNPEILKMATGNGWKNIQSRLNLVKGELEIDSNPERKGTTLILNVPVKKESITSEG